jgi:hypothetical protein
MLMVFPTTLGSEPKQRCQTLSGNCSLRAGYLIFFDGEGAPDWLPGQATEIACGNDLGAGPLRAFD